MHGTVHVMFDLDEFEDTFTALAKELKNAKLINVKELVEHAQKRSEQKPLFRDYNPTVIDFLQRCKTNEEGIEIIEFLAKRGEISREEKDELLHQLNTNGIRSFGPLRKPGYYDKQDRMYKLKLKQQRAKKDTKESNTNNDQEQSSSVITSGE